jgi:hypothetical protein
MSVQSRYQQQHQEHRDQYHYNHDQEQRRQSNDFAIYSTTSIWLSGLKRRPTIFLPTDLAEKYKMNEACTIAVIDNSDGILLKFIHSNNIRSRPQKQEQTKQ